MDKRPKIYMANPDLTTYGSGKYTGIMFMRAGAQNVAAQSIKGYKQVSAEQVLAWAPQIIFVQIATLRCRPSSNPTRSLQILAPLKRIKFT